MVGLIRFIFVIISLFECLVPHAALANEVLRPFRNSNGRWGYIDTDHCWSIRPRFDEAYWFREGLARIVVNGLVGFADRTGRIVIPPTYSDPRLNPTPSPIFNSLEEALSGSVAPIIEGMRIDRVQSEAWYFSEGLAAVLVGQLWGYIDQGGRMAIPAQFSEAYAFSDGLARVKIGSRYGYIDRLGKVQINPQFEDAESFIERLAAVKFGGLWGFVDNRGRMVINPIYQSANAFSDGLAAVRVSDRMGFIDRSGRTVIAPQFSFAQRFSEGLAGVEVRDKLWGYIDRSGRIVIAPQFEIVQPFHEGLAGVGVNGRFINKSGHTVIHIPSATLTQKFRGGIGSILLGSSWVSIDRTGKMLLDPTCGAM